MGYGHVEGHSSATVQKVAELCSNWTMKTGYLQDLGRKRLGLKHGGWNKRSLVSGVVRIRETVVGYLSNHTWMDGYTVMCHTVEANCCCRTKSWLVAST